MNQRICGDLTAIPFYGHDILTLQGDAWDCCPRSLPKSALHKLEATARLLTAPSAISYERLKPHRWSAAFNNLGLHDREASLRICPITTEDTESTARQFNFEFRAADAAASPYLALAGAVCTV